MMYAISASIAEGMGGTVSETQEATPSPVINIDFSVNYSDYNSVAAITAPEDAQVIPYEMLLQGMMSGMSSSMGGGMGSDAVPMETPEAESSG
jgi:hypothetical protein